MLAEGELVEAAGAVGAEVGEDVWALDAGSGVVAALDAAVGPRSTGGGRRRRRCGDPGRDARHAGRRHGRRCGPG